MARLTTHVLDTRLGLPAAGLEIRLEHRDAANTWQLLASGVTNASGRLDAMPAAENLAAGRHRLVFVTGQYFEKLSVEHIYPEVTVEFDIAEAQQHYHMPLILSPFGYSTYRGS